MKAEAWGETMEDELRLENITKCNEFVVNSMTGVGIVVMKGKRILERFQPSVSYK